MNLIKLWVAQDSNGECYIFKYKPIEIQKGNWFNENGKYPTFIGDNLLTKAELKRQPIKVAVMSFDKLNSMIEE